MFQSTLELTSRGFKVYHVTKFRVHGCQIPSSIIHEFEKCWLHGTGFIISRLWRFSSYFTAIKITRATLVTMATRAAKPNMSIRMPLSCWKYRIKLLSFCTLIKTMSHLFHTDGRHYNMVNKNGYSTIEDGWGLCSCICSTGIYKIS